jgi:hypothetical protein
VPDLSTGAWRCREHLHAHAEPTDVNRAGCSRRTWRSSTASRATSRSSSPTSTRARTAATPTATSTTASPAAARRPGSTSRGRDSDITEWAARTKRRYNALQVAINRPFKNGLLLKGAYTLSKSQNETDEDGWVSLPWYHPRSWTTTSRSRATTAPQLQMGFLYDLPFAKSSKGRCCDREELADQRDLLRLLGDAVLDRRHEPGAQLPGLLVDRHADQRAGSIRSRAARRGRTPSPGTTRRLFSQPTGTGIDGFGTSERNQFRTPPMWNFDFGSSARSRSAASARSSGLGHQPVQPHQLGRPVRSFTDRAS